MSRIRILCRKRLQTLNRCLNFGCFLAPSCQHSRFSTKVPNDLKRLSKNLVRTFRFASVVNQPASCFLAVRVDASVSLHELELLSDLLSAVVLNGVGIVVGIYCRRDDGSRVGTTDRRNQPLRLDDKKGPAVPGKWVDR